MRPILLFFFLAVAATFIAMFFVSQCSEHVRIGYQLTQLRHQRDQLREDARQLEYNIARARSPESLLQSAQKFGLDLQPPIDESNPQRGTR